VTIEGDIPVACTSSGAIYLLEQVVSVNAGDLERAVRVLEVSGTEARLIGLPCAACRSTVSTDLRIEKSVVCTYRPLRGPLFVPRRP
jgi:hypothetical protein